MKYGLDDKYFDKLISVFPNHPEVESVILYGSRAKGNYKPFSDIDITLKGSALTRQIMGRIFTEIDDLLLPYFLDISIYDKLTDKNFIAAIDKTGVEIYRKSETQGFIFEHNHQLKLI